MKSTHVSAALIAAFALTAAVSAHADVATQSAQGIHATGPKFNGIQYNGLALNGPGVILQGRNLNGLAMNGQAMNGPGLVLQGKLFNGTQLNGPGIVLQGKAFNGVRLNGPGLILQGKAFNGIGGADGLVVRFADVGADLTSIANCAAPQSVGDWPLRALHTSSVKVRLAPR